MKALVDSGAQQNYVSAQAAERAGLTLLPKLVPYLLTVANGKPMPGESTVTHEVRRVPLHIQTHQEVIDLHVIDLASKDIILGLPWLQEHNPVIDWKNRKLMFRCCGTDATTSKPTPRLSARVDENAINNIGSKKDDLKKQESGSTITNNDVRVLEKHVTPDIPKEYKDFAYLFAEVEDADALPAHQPWDHEITLEEGKQPGFGPIYGMSGKELQVLQKWIDKSSKKGYIRESKSPAGSPMLFVPKPGGELRPCIDYRKLNAITIKDRHPLPNISELRDRLSTARIFTALDLRDGYHLVRIKKGEEWKTAFRTRYGHYEFLVMPFGLTNAPATFQRLINNVLRAHLDIFVVAYLDDILIYSDNEEDHIGHVRQVLQCLAEFNLRLKPEKCKFHQQELPFLGHIVGIHGVKMSEEKIKVVKDWPTPKNVTDVQSFLGFINFNRQFIKDFSNKAIPLTKLTRKDTAWDWGTAQQKAFDELKRNCIEPPVLVVFRSDEPLRIETDASDLALGACAKQEREGKWHPVAYYSRKFSSAEENYDVHDKELMAIVAAIGHWRIYAESCSELTVFSDHKNLTNFLTTKVLNRRQVRWAELLGQYRFRIVYTPGKENGRADALSRRPDIAGTKEIKNAALLKKNADGSLGMAQASLNNIMTITARVPEELEEPIIRSHHDDPVHGHPGVKRTMELIKRYYDFPNMKEKVERILRQCDTCHKAKHNTHAQYGQMQALELPTVPWEDISMDFVTGLPWSTDPTTGFKYNAILVVVCRFTKEAEYIPWLKGYNAKQLAHIINDRIIARHGIPKSIISDRDPLFTSNFWATLLAMIGTKRRLSTAYHPQTDGQTERTNRTMKAYLRMYTNEKQDNWVSILPMAQLAYNNKLSEATGMTPFFANHGRHPNLFTKTYPSPKAEAAITTAEEWKQTHETLKQSLEKAQTASISHVNKKRKMAPQLREGDKVYLLTKNLRTKRPSKSLDHTKVGPFLIKSQISPVNYTLDLPPDAKIHPRFHVSMLEPADPATPLQTTFHYEVEEENEFEVERILEFRPVEGTRGTGRGEYLVKWLGYPESENTWEPEENLNNCKQLLENYKKKQREKRKQYEAR